MTGLSSCSTFFFFNDTATTEIYTLSLHDALPISDKHGKPIKVLVWDWSKLTRLRMGQYTAKLFMVYDDGQREDRKSTRLNSSHSQISYAVFCLKKKTPQQEDRRVGIDSLLRFRQN